MPYKIKGKTILHFKNGKWSIKQKSRNKTNAERALRLLRGIEHGMKPRTRR